MNSPSYFALQDEASLRAYSGQLARSAKDGVSLRTNAGHQVREHLVYEQGNANIPLLCTGSLDLAAHLDSVGWHVVALTADPEKAGRHRFVIEWPQGTPDPLDEVLAFYNSTVPFPVQPFTLLRARARIIDRVAAYKKNCF